MQTLAFGYDVRYSFAMKRNVKRHSADFSGGILSTAMAESRNREGIGKNRRVTILATLHEVQGAEQRNGTVKDPKYIELLNQLLVAETIDFVFEEASGLGPTIAEKLSLDQLGPNRYLDVDPHRNDREKFGIPRNSHDFYMIGTPPAAAFASWQFHEVHALREEFWVQQLTEREFKSALMVCGLAHMLSFASRLHAACFSVKTLEYANWQRNDAPKT
jgi:hypothetical protein